MPEIAQSRKPPRPLAERYADLKHREAKSLERRSNFEQQVLEVAGGLLVPQKVAEQDTDGVLMSQQTESYPSFLPEREVEEADLPLQADPEVTLPSDSDGLDPRFPRADASSASTSPEINSPRTVPTARNSGNPQRAIDNVSFLDGLSGRHAVPASQLRNPRFPPK